MIITTGDSALNKIVEVSEKLLEDNPLLKDASNDTFIISKITPNFIKSLLKRPFIFYTKNKSLGQSTHKNHIEEFTSDIFFIEDIELILFLRKLPHNDLENYQVKWILVESDKSIMSSYFLKQVVYLDYWQDRKKSNSVGRLDYEKMEEHFKEGTTKTFLSALLKKTGNYFYTPLLNLSLSSKKTPYAKQELRHYKTPDNIQVDHRQYKEIFVYRCIICNEAHNVALHGNTIEKKISEPKKMISFDTDTSYLEFNCEHEGTKYKNYPKPAMKIFNHDFSLVTDDMYNKAFLYIFYRLKREGDYIKYLEGDSQIQKSTIETYLSNIKDKKHA